MPRLGEKTFEQAAGFLRVMGGDNPLDASAVHPESYPLVEKILADIKKDMKAVIGDAALLKTLNPARYADDKFGVPTITDILKELEKPGRDPRPEFTTATFKEGVEELRDLRPDMILEGVVTNVAAFGAFVDIGVHQDGLVHISALSNTFVKDPHTVVKAGQVVRVKVLEVDEKRKRIALTMRLTDSAPQPGVEAGAARRPHRRQAPGAAPEAGEGAGAGRRQHGGRLRQAARLSGRRLRRVLTRRRRLLRPSYALQGGRTAPAANLLPSPHSHRRFLIKCRHPFIFSPRQP